MRFDRLTPLEKKYLRAMAELGPGPHRSGDIAELRPSEAHAGVRRAARGRGPADDRRTGLPAGTLNRELARLADAGLLKRERRGNQLLYSAERGCPVFEELASILRKTSGVADVLAAALAPAREEIRAAFVYGSVAGGRARPGSDLDLIVVGDLGFGDAVKLLHPAQEILGRDISPRVYGVKEWKQKRRAPDAFLREVLAKPKIFVMGGERELG